MAGTSQLFGVEDDRVFAVAFGRSCPAPFASGTESCHIFEEDYINAGADASSSATASAAMLLLCGPPCSCGKTAKSIACLCARR